MTAELNIYTRELLWVLDQFIHTLRGLSDHDLRWRPDTGHANSAGVITTHVVAATRVYALGFGCGRKVRRDRAAEFADSSSSVGELVGAVQQLSTDLETALASLHPSVLEDRISPPQELWGTGEPMEISRREALVEAIRHAAIHLGELRLTRDLAV